MFKFLMVTPFFVLNCNIYYCKHILCLFIIYKNMQNKHKIL
jgi:hypothetical protein